MDRKLKDIPFVTWEQMKKVEHLVTDEYGITLIQMMENTGRALALKTRDITKDVRSPRIAIFAGTGGNGGGAMVAARRLFNWGYKVTLYLSKEQEEYEGIPLKQLEIAMAIGIPVYKWSSLYLSRDYELIIDGVIGYSLKSSPRGTPKDMILFMNKQNAPVISLDIPSGVDPDEGVIYPFYVKADYTVTLGLPKKCFCTEGAETALGDIFLADISIPPKVFEKVGITMGPFFKDEDIIRLL